MKNGTMLINIEDKYKEIKKDIMDNISEVFDREHYYTHKYRGDILNDINVAINTESNINNVVRIYVKNDTGYIRDIITITPDNKFKSKIDSNFINNERRD